MRILRVLPPCLVALAFLLATAVSSQADIYRWDTGEVIPGTEGITPGPGVQLDHRDLAFADLDFEDLTNSRFDFSDLTYASLHTSTLTNANFNGAVVNYTQFRETTARGFTKEQLYSTASYEAKNLEGIGLVDNDLSDWDFRGQNLVNAQLFFSTLTNADLSGAVVTGARFDETTSRGFTKEQLYSTASYQAKNLQGISLSDNNLRNWDFSGQEVTGASFWNTTSRGFTKEQLYSTASYQEKNLQGIGLAENDLSGWDFHDQDLTNARLFRSVLTNANLEGAIVAGADLLGTVSRGFTKEKLYSTASFQAKNLPGIQLGFNVLSGWDFHGQNLANAYFQHANLTNANLSGANLANVVLGKTNLTNADLSAADVRGAYRYDGQTLDLTGANSFNTIRPDGIIAGLNLAAGDQLVIRNYQGDPLRGTGPIPIVVQGDMNMGGGGALKMLFDADDWHSTMSFQPGILVALGGSLELAFADGVLAAEQAGRTFDLFDWTGQPATGAFDVHTDYLWDLSQLYTTGEVTLLSALSGDTNGDGGVDLEDLNNVRNHFGGTGAPGLPGDAIPFDGVVDLSDLNAVRNNFGATNGASAVPEPTTGLLLVAGCFCFGVWHLARSAVQRKGVSAIARRIALAMAMLCPCAAARAETVEWIRQLGTPLSDSAQGVTVDPFGSIFVTGNVLGQTSNPDAGTDDFFVSKYDPSGAVIWTRQFGTTARDVSYGIAADALGNVFVAGNTTGSLAAPNDGQPTPNEPFLSKLDTNGEVLWTQQFGSLHGFSDVAVDLHGDVIVAATGVSKISAAGERLWTRQIFDGTGPIVGNSIATDSDGNIFIAGSASASSAFLNKYGEDGNLLWTRVFQLEEQNKAGGVAADNDGNIYVTGITAESFAFPQYDGFLRKYDESGSLLWSRQFGDPEGFDTFSDIALDDLGNIVVVGTQRDPGATGAGPYDALAVMYDADGELQWTRRLASDGDDSASAVAMAGNGRIYIVGETRGDLGGPRAGEYDAFLAKIRLGDLLPGDADGDGDVDLADLNAVRNDFGIAGDGIPGDTNADGIVDLEDLNAVRNNFSATGGGAAVPEPETAVLLVSLAAALLLGCALNAQAVTAKRGRYGALISMMLLALVSTPSAAREIVAIDRLRYALFDFSANGMVAVGSTPEQGIEPAYWTRATGTQNFLEFTPYNDGFATGVSGDGRVICGHGSPNGAFRWTAEEGPIGLGGWTTKEISQDGGTIVGQRSDRPVIWNQQQGMLELSAPAGWNYGYFKSVSADGGVVAAVAEVHPSEGVVAAQQAMLWNRQSGYRGIGTLPDGWVTSFPIQLSADGGTLLGTAKQQMGDSPQGLPFLWTVESGVEALPTLAGGRYTDLHMTSDASVVVGNEWVDNEFTPVVWDAQHGARPLRDVLRESHGFTDEELSFNLVRGISDDQRVIVMIAPSATSTDFDTYAIYLDRPLTLDGLPGDTDADGDVDLHDLNNVRNHFGGTGLGDTNADGTVDLEDLNAVRNYFGEVSPATVPEPASWILLTLGACGSFCRFVKKIGG